MGSGDLGKNRRGKSKSKQPEDKPAIHYYHEGDGIIQRR